MNKRIILIADCEKLVKVDQKQRVYQFHFSGAYRGKKIDTVLLNCDCELQIRKTYCLYIIEQMSSQKTLFAKLVRYKEIN
jgi:hypothetical protein